MKLAVVGSQHLTNRQIREAKWLIEMIFNCYPSQGVTFVSGGCVGVDQLAEGLAREHFFEEPIIHYPKTKDWPGYRARNILIAEDADVLIAIRSITSKTNGSGWTADCAEGLGKLVRRLYV